MKIVDLNVLIYAHNRESPHHDALRSWWQAALNGGESIGLAWPVMLGFLRITTNPKIYGEALTPEFACSLVDGWLQRPMVVILKEQSNHWAVVEGLISETGAAGNLTTDAHLAALAMTYDAVLVSCDSDFVRFEGVRWENPLRSKA